MRLVISIVAFLIGLLGCIFVMYSLVDNLTVNYAHFAAAVAGFGMIGLAMIIALLVGILDEIKKLNNK